MDLPILSRQIAGDIQRQALSHAVVVFFMGNTIW
jgi:hypothetical protein